VHTLERGVPRTLGEQRVRLRTLRLGVRCREKALARGDERRGRVGNLDEPEVAVGADDVLDRRRKDRQPRRQVLGRLCRADEARGLVTGEGQHADVPACEIPGKLAIRLAAEIGDVGALRERRRVDLHDGAEHDELPVRARVGGAREQRYVEPLVDHARESDARPRQTLLIGDFGLRRTRRAEVRGVHARREEMHVLVSIKTRLIGAPPTGEDHVRRFHQALLALGERGRGVREAAQLVHAVVDDGRRLECGGDVDPHRGVQPCDDALHPARSQCLADERGADGARRRPSVPGGRWGTSTSTPLSTERTSA
jgi:hypothetical protein